MKFFSSSRRGSSASPRPSADGSVRMGKAKVFFYDNPDSDRCVLVFPDTDGVDGGRVKENCARLSALYKVVLVDLNPENDFPPDQKAKPRVGLLEYFRPVAEAFHLAKWIRKHDFDHMRAQINDVFAYMQRDHDVTKFALMGYTWGALFAWRYCSMEGLPISCGILVSPCGFIDGFTLCFGPGRDLGQQVLVPQLLLCGQDEFDHLKPGKEVETDLKSRPFTSELRHFPDMQDRWFSRGDLSDPQVARDVQVAWDDAIVPFLALNLH
ncbi:hypothetical protein LEN26_012933 [Aphanomyces euteiches]|nr:hypothetical protein LEN26_012933 [Aphanomyces euteiches]KAH9123645.1 hypothetical protein AeMF1_005427 [Aphanomyces euteiches]KAH9124128.1 hypothetical protein AeMF1_005060 [Aphanomyces euteiches]KAH9183795.1 hypothetical protein AeNC1_014227 [Aphanomyces euteiches]